MDEKVRNALIVGDLFSLHTFRVARSLLSKGWTIFGFPIVSKKAYLEEHLNIYKEIASPFFPESYYQKTKLGKFIYLVKERFNFKLDFHTDISVINFQSVSPIIAFLFRSSQVDSPIISSFWGSEIWENLPWHHRYYQYKLLKNSQIITVVTKTMKKRVKEVFPGIPESKIRLVRYGMLDIHVIDRVDENSVNKFKKQLNIPENSVICTISYASAYRHRQDKVLKVIETLDVDTIREKNVIFVLPLTYGDHNYKEYLKNYAKKHRYSDRMIIIENTLENEEVAVLRRMTDIFINVPTQDTFSATMCEHFYAGSIVITGGWLPYDDIFNSDIFLLSVENIENSLRKALINALENIDEYKKKAEKNKKIVPKLMSNDMWSEIFEEAVEIWKKERR